MAIYQVLEYVVLWTWLTTFVASIRVSQLITLVIDPIRVAIATGSVAVAVYHDLEYVVLLVLTVDTSE